MFFDSESDNESSDKENTKSKDKDKDKDKENIVQPEMVHAAVRHNLGAPIFVKSSSSTLEEEEKEIQKEKEFLSFFLL